jgi:hypothetical protein
MKVTIEYDNGKTVVYDSEHCWEFDVEVSQTCPYPVQPKFLRDITTKHYIAISGRQEFYASLQDTSPRGGLIVRD